jgi:hypothetical protein
MRQPANQGPAVARNCGLENSQGEFVIFLDADDWWDARCLEALVDVLCRAAPGVAIAHADWAYAGDAAHAVRVVSSEIGEGDALSTLVLRNPFAIHCALARRSALMVVGGFPTEEPALEDWELWLRLAAAGYGFVHVPEVLAYYCWRPGSKGGDVAARKADRLATLERLWAQACLPEALLGLRGRSYGTAHVDFCVSRFGQGQIQVALQELETAIGYDPASAAAVDTFYRVAYAGGGPHAEFDGRAASERIEITLSHLADMTPQVDIRASRHAAKYALAMVGYRRGDKAFALRHFAQALWWKPGALGTRHAFRFLVKALLPNRIIRALCHAGNGAW